MKSQTSMKTFLLGAVLLLAFTPLLSSADDGFGSKDPGLYNLKGSIYFLPDTTQRMPEDLDKQKPVGNIYTEKLDIPQREFKEGFPGVTDRFEWFGLLYTGQFQVEKPGTWTWRIVSDDGSRLWIDGKEVIDNDGVHGMESKEGSIDLAAGPHPVKVWYYQGPATDLGIQLFVTPPGGDEQIFNIANYSKGLEKAVSAVKAEATKEGIKINFDAAVLFDTAKSELKPSAAPTIKSAAQIICSYPEAMVRIFGHTDSVGKEEYNQKLSEARAASVRNALIAAGAPKSVRFEVKGFGKASPIATNDTEAGRQKNRRVEVLIQP